MVKRLGAIEAGGTGFAVSLAIDTPTNVIHQVSIDTSTPTETLTKVCLLLYSWSIDCLGIGSFGPIDLVKSSPTYGYITSTPKPLWGHTDIVGSVRTLLTGIAEFFANPSSPVTVTTCTGHNGAEQTVVIDSTLVDGLLNIDDDVVTGNALTKSDIDRLPIAFTTDCNTAAIAEVMYGNHGDHMLSSCCYITVGTGIGIGLVAHGEVIEGLMHPEGGHIIVRKHVKDMYEGSCPYHKDWCCEGLANNIAIADRLNIDRRLIETVDTDTEVNGINIWHLEAFYLAQLCANVILTVSPELIVIGGGVLNREGLLQKVHEQTLTLLNGYIQAPRLINNIADYIVLSRFNGKDSKTTSGAVGALHIGLMEANK